MATTASKDISGSELGLTDVTADFLNRSDLEFLESTYTIDPNDSSKLNIPLNSTVTIIENDETDPTSVLNDDEDKENRTADKENTCENDTCEPENHENEACSVTETVEVLKEIADIFNTKLSLRSVNLCSKLVVDEGADPNALAEILKKWRRSKAPKPKRVLGHFFEKVESESKREWIP